MSATTAVIRNVPRVLPDERGVTRVPPPLDPVVPDDAVRILSNTLGCCDVAKANEFVQMVQSDLRIIYLRNSIGGTLSGPGIRQHALEVDHYLSTLRDELINQRDKFDTVFQTQKGSTYFTGSFGVFRIKRDPSAVADGSGEFSMEPIHTDCHFLTRDAADQYLKARRAQETAMGLVGHTFETASLQIGVLPLEFGKKEIKALGAGISLVAGNGTVTFGSSNPRGEFDAAIHLGHQVSRIF